MSDLHTRPFGAPELNSWRSVLAFSVLSHVLDLITTQFRDPALVNEGNPFYMLALRFGYSGWTWLVLAKVMLVANLALAFWWYLGIRHHYLPDKIVRSARSLIWYGMWDRKPYPKSVWGRLFNARKLKFMGVVLAGIALPGSGAAALFISVDNVLFGLGRPLSMQVAGECLMGSVLLVCIWWYRAYWRYYQDQVQRGAIKDVT